jgi:glycosyltransferase involved in cell wall biosynthesis
LPLKAKRALQDEPRAVRAELETPSDATVIIQVSRMEAWKGQSSLLKALGRLKDRRDWMCWMVGGVQTAAEVAYAQSLRDLADGLGIAGRVKFLGERSDVARLLAASDVFCQPNRSTEGFSIVFMEAFLASLPIVTTAIGGALEMVDDSCGVLVPLNDEDVLTAALQRLIDTPNLRTLLGGRGYRRVHEMCDPETQLRKLNGILAALIERKTRNS